MSAGRPRCLVSRLAMSPKAAFYDDDDMHDEWSDEEEFWDEDEPAVEPAVKQSAKKVAMSAPLAPLVGPAACYTPGQQCMGPAAPAPCHDDCRPRPLPPVPSRSSPPSPSRPPPLQLQQVLLRLHVHLWIRHPNARMASSRKAVRPAMLFCRALCALAANLRSSHPPLCGTPGAAACSPYNLAH